MNEDSRSSTDGREEDARYASFFHHHPHATYALDRAGYFTDANRPGLEMTGLTLAQLRRTHFSQVIHPDDLHLVRGAFERALAGELSVTEARVRREDGELVDFRTTVIPVIVNGGVVGVHGVAEDTTETNQILRELEAANACLERTNAELEEANAAKTLFLANVSHEIRTPLSAIMGATEILLDAQLDTTSKHLAHMIERNGDRLFHLVSDLLDFSGLAAHRVSVRLRPFDVRALIDGVADWAVPLASNRDLAISFVVDDSVPARLVGDALRVEQVVSNLVQNAIKFTEAGSVDVRVSARFAVQDNEEPAADVHVEFNVTDTGIGIAADGLASLFEPFTQADPSATRAYQGVGLGLAVCRDLAELMGGHLLVESRVGEGTTFTFGVPMGRSVEESK